VKRVDAKLIAERKRNLESRLRRDGELHPGNYNLDFEVSCRARGTAHGGVSAMLELARATGLTAMIDGYVAVLDEHRPYKESDHVLAIVASVLTGGTCVEDLRRLRQDADFLDSVGMRRFPDSTTAGDFLRRFERQDIEDLMDALLMTSQQVLEACLPTEERKLGIIDADGTITPTDAECMEGIDYCGYKRQWGYAPLLISLANTGQPLAIVNRPGNAPSAQDAAQYLDKTSEAMLEVFERVLMRADTDFSQSKHLDGWHESGRRDFVFGFDACPALVAKAQALGAGAWRLLKRPAHYEVKTAPREKPERVKDAIVAQRGYRTLRTVREDIAQFEHQPGACTRAYRMVVVRKEIEVTEGQLELENEIRYFFYITNMRDLPAEQIVFHGNKRCNQENLIAQLAGQVHALSPASNTLESNWAWMLIASLAWTLKSWFALFAREETERKRLLGMEFRTFVNLFMHLPVQIIRTARRTIARILGGHLPSLPVFLNIWADIRRLRRIRI
jgi:hypothetical protein